MAISIATAATRITAAASNVATQMGGGTTAAEVQAIGKLLAVLADRPDRLMGLLALVNDKQLTEKR